MQRIQDHPQTTASLPSANSLSAQPSSAPRARRGSGYPPLSHQDQIMKAMSRSSTLPSLSISIPPSLTQELPSTPAQDLPPKTSDSSEEPSPVKEERTKTVTFSNPEEDDSNLSDQSSICHSPSWEGWSKKTKRPNKPDPGEAQKPKEKPGKTLRKKGNRLSKPPPQSPMGISTIQSQSALELEPRHTAEKPVANAAQPGQQEPMAQAKAGHKQPTSQGEGKSKSKRFLSGFRLQHGNMTGVKKLMENSRKDAETAQPGQGPDPPAPSSRKSHPAGSGIDTGHVGAPESTATPSMDSHSSAEKRGSTMRPPSASSNHGRSQSLLSSTLNKLRGPSYLYYRPQDGSSNSSSKRPVSRDNEGPQPTAPAESRPGSSGGPGPATAKFAFAQRFKHKSAASTSSVPLDLASTSQPPAPKDLNKDCDPPEPEPFPNHHGFMSSAKASDPETIRGSQEHIQRRSELQGNPHVENNSTEQQLDSRLRKSQATSLDPKRRHHRVRKASSQMQQPAEKPNKFEQDSASSSPDEDYTSTHEHQSDHASATHRQFRGGASQIDAKNLAPTIRPSSKDRDNNPLTKSRRSEPSPAPTPSADGPATDSNLDTQPGTDKSDRSPKGEKPDLQKEGYLRIPLQQIRPKQSIEQPTDYYSFINESYAPPSLELRSPLETLLQSLSKTERFEKLENPAASQSRPSSSRKEDVGPESSDTSDTQAATSRGRISNEPVHRKKQQDSPAVTPRISQHDVPSFERLNGSTKTIKVSSSSDAGSTSTRQSQRHEASHSTSERSSSSTFGDTPPSPSSMTTPESSRPHSHKSRPPSHLDLSRTRAVTSSPAGEEKVKSRAYPVYFRERSSSRSRPRSKEANVPDDNWSRSALPLDLENDSSISLAGADGFAPSPALVSTPTSMTFADALKEEIAEGASSKSNSRESLHPKAHSALDLPSTSSLQSSKRHVLNHKKTTSKLAVSVTSAPSLPLQEHMEEPLKSALKKPRNSGANGQDSHIVVSAGAAYLQEARKTVSGAPGPAPRVLRPPFSHRNNAAVGAKGTATPARTEPMAKMLVECCNCHFFHDMPARVYECMAKPDSIVEDKTLGVSAAITTMVKCPWCSHGMTTQCCSGYAAVVYLKEKLHGK